MSPAWLNLPLVTFDRYEVRARLAPALILVLPVILPIRFLLPQEIIGWLEALFIWAFVLYGLTIFVGSLGRRREPRLWKLWDGPPSTRFCRWRDGFWGKQRKEALHVAIIQHLKIEPFSPQKERARPDEADRQIADAFGQVKELLRRRDGGGLWFTHLADYGFARNLLASAWLGILLSLLGAAVSAGFLWKTESMTALVAFAAELVFALVLLSLRYAFLPAATKQRADRYAEAAWEAFLIVVRSDDKPTKPNGQGSPHKGEAAEPSTKNPSEHGEDQA
jgi:hypothetical protein